MRILHLVHQYLPEQIGGTELHTQWLAHKLRQRGNQVAIFYRRDAPGNGLESWDDEQGVRIYAAWSGRLTPQRRFMATFGDKNLLDAFRQTVEQFQPDLVHIQHLMGLPVSLVDHIQRAKIPYVITLHDYWWICANAQLLTNYSQQVCQGPRAYLNCARCALARSERSRLWPALPALAVLLAWRNRMLRPIIKSANQLMAATKFVANWYATRDAPSERLVVIPHGLAPPLHKPAKRLRAGEQLRFAYIGGLSPQKGVHVLLQAMNGLGPGAELWIAGDESAYPDYVSSLRAQAPPQARFLGKLNREQIWQTLAQVDVLLVPSLWYETFALVISEAFLAGAPVLASRLGPLADRVRDGVDGLLIPPGDPAAWRAAMQRFVDEPDLLPRLQANLRPPTMLDEFTDQVQALYVALVDRKPQA